MLVSAAHSHETPVASPVVRTLMICGKNCGIASTAAATGT